jgi:hypothetical protein
MSQQIETIAHDHGIDALRNSQRPCLRCQVVRVIPAPPTTCRHLSRWSAGFAGIAVSVHEHIAGRIDAERPGQSDDFDIGWSVNVTEPEPCPSPG